MSTISKILGELAKFDTPTICNSIELFNFRSRTEGYMDRRIRAHFPELPPTVGFAATSTFRAGAPAGSDCRTSVNDLIELFATLPGAPIVVLQELDDRSTAATFGDVMCTMCRDFGAVGLISSGAGRDVEQLRSMRFPIFSDGLICSHGYAHFVDVGVPVHVGGLVVQPGDLLHGDSNGITSIPRSIIDELPQVAAEFVEAEQSLMKFLHSPEKKTLAQCDSHRGEFRAAVKKIGDRVARFHK